MLAGSLFEHTRDQDRIAADTLELRQRRAIETPPIDEIAPARELHIILADWRDAERRLATAIPQSTEASDAQADVHRLRHEYCRAAQSAWDQERRQ